MAELNRYRVTEIAYTQPMTNEQLREKYPYGPTTKMTYACGHSYVAKRNLANPDVDGDYGQYECQMPMKCRTCRDAGL